MVCLAPNEQIQRFRSLNDWIKTKFPKETPISEEAFANISAEVAGKTADVRIFYGFGDDGHGNADISLTSHIFLTYLLEKFPHEKWSFVDFYPSPPDPGHFDFFRPVIKLREGAASRPKGFYTKTLLPNDFDGGIGTTHQKHSPAEVRKLSPWGWGPEGFQFLAIEESYIQKLHDGKVPTFVLGDYAVAPYGKDFSSTVLLGSARNRLEIGVTNVRDNIPKYAPSHFV